MEPGIRLLVIMLLDMLSVPPFIKIAPPVLPPRPFAMVMPLIVRLAGVLIFMMRTALFPLMVSWLAPGPLIVISVLIVGSVEPRVIVAGVLKLKVIVSGPTAAFAAL